MVIWHFLKIFAYAWQRSLSTKRTLYLLAAGAESTRQLQQTPMISRHFCIISLKIIHKLFYILFIFRFKLLIRFYYVIFNIHFCSFYKYSTHPTKGSVHYGRARNISRRKCHLESWTSVALNLYELNTTWQNHIWLYHVLKFVKGRKAFMI
jgi:hypothetical protein